MGMGYLRHNKPQSCIICVSGTSRKCKHFDLGVGREENELWNANTFRLWFRVWCFLAVLFLLLVFVVACSYRWCILHSFQCFVAFFHTNGNFVVVLQLLEEGVNSVGMHLICVSQWLSKRVPGFTSSGKAAPGSRDRRLLLWEALRVGEGSWKGQYLM